MKIFSKVILLIFIVFLPGLQGCATIPHEAPELSVQLGKRISDIEDSNITLLNRFFDQKRKEIDRFIEEEWVPTFAENFFANPQVSKAWDTVVRENDKEQRLQFLVRMGPVLQKKINQKRLELIQPLDELERRIEKTIRDEYAQARSINNSITSFLLSAAKVAENRDRYLGMVGLTDQKIGPVIDKTDEVVSNLISKAKDAPDKVQKAEEYIEKLREIREKF